METLDLRVRADQNAGHRKRRANYRAGDSPQYLAKASVAAGYAAAAAAKPWDPMGQAADPIAGYPKTTPLVGGYHLRRATGASPPPPISRARRDGKKVRSSRGR
jgi:hypothetical protein